MMALLVRDALWTDWINDWHLPVAFLAYFTLFLPGRSIRWRLCWLASGTLYQEANRTGLSAEQIREAKYRVAEYISANPDRIYFNDAI